MALGLQGEVLNVVDRSYTPRDSQEVRRSAVSMVLTGDSLDSSVVEVRADGEHYDAFMAQMPKFHRKQVSLDVDAVSYRDSSNVAFKFLRVRGGAAG